MSIDHLARAGIDALRGEFAAPGRHWASHVAGCLYLLHQNDLIDLKASSASGLNLAILSTIPPDAGVGSSAALEIATIMNLVDHFSLRDTLDPMKIAVLCQEVQSR